MRATGRPRLLKIGVLLIALQSLSLLAVSGVGIVLNGSQVKDIGRISGWGDSLSTLLRAAALLGFFLLVMAIMLARRSRVFRWLAVSVEAVLFLLGTVIASQAWTSPIDLSLVWMTVVTLLCSTVVLYGLVVDRSVRQFFSQWQTGGKRFDDASRG